MSAVNPETSTDLSTEEPGEEDLTPAQTERLLPPAIDLFSQVDWGRAPKMLAIALATHQVVDENMHRIHDLALEHLHLHKRPKKIVSK